MFDIRELNIAIELWGVVFCALGIICTMLFTRTERTLRIHMITLFALVLIAAGGDAAAGVYRGRPGPVAWMATHVGNPATFCANFLLLSAYTSYLLARIDGEPSLRRRWCYVVWSLGTLMCLPTILGTFFYIDAANVYHRTGLYWLATAYAVPFGVVDSALTIYNRERLNAPLFGCLMFYNLVPIFVPALQALVYGPNFTIVADVVSMLILFLEIQTYSSRILMERSEQLVRSQAELSESRIQAMVSQIQPHFLFNALDSIYLLCEEDPARAQQAVDMFSTYLRANLASLRQPAPVPIETELAHVRTYLELEKLSMEDLLQWEIDTQATGFDVPALSVQTLAENAVRHGVAKRPGGGKVTVRTSEDDADWLILVIDDGVGFDTSLPVGEGHVGLDNTRQRLAALCDGTLEISSEPGMGTTVCIRIPKGMS